MKLYHKKDAILIYSSINRIGAILNYYKLKFKL